MSMYRIIGADQKVYGPVSAEQMRQWIREGRAIAETQVQVEGSDVWQSLSRLPEFFSAPAPLANLAPPPFQSAPLPPPLTAQRVPRRTNGYAITGFVLGLVGLPCFWFPPISLLGIIFSVVGLMQVRRRPWQAGRPLALAGLIISAITLAITIALGIMFGMGTWDFTARENYS